MNQVHLRSSSVWRRPFCLFCPRLYTDYATFDMLCVTAVIDSEERIQPRSHAQNDDHSSHARRWTLEFLDYTIILQCKYANLSSAHSNNGRSMLMWKLAKPIRHCIVKYLFKNFPRKSITNSILNQAIAFFMLKRNTPIFQTSETWHLFRKFEIFFTWKMSEIDLAKMNIVGRNRLKKQIATICWVCRHGKECCFP